MKNHFGAHQTHLSLVWVKLSNNLTFVSLNFKHFHFIQFCELHTFCGDLNFTEIWQLKATHSQMKEESYHSSVYFWPYDISRSDQKQHCLHAVSAKHSVCLHVSRAVNTLWPSDVRGMVWQWTLIGPSRIYFPPVVLIRLYFIRLWATFDSIVSKIKIKSSGFWVWVGTCILHITKKVLKENLKETK